MPQEYFIKRNGKISGPFSLGQIEKAVQAKKLKKTDEVCDCRDGYFVSIPTVIKEIISGKWKSYPLGKPSMPESPERLPAKNKIRNEEAAFGQLEEHLSKPKNLNKENDTVDFGLIRIPPLGQIRLNNNPQVKFSSKADYQNNRLNKCWYCHMANLGECQCPFCRMLK